MRTVLALAALLAAPPAMAQNCTTNFIGQSAFTNCYGNNGNSGYNDYGQAAMQQGMNNFSIGMHTLAQKQIAQAQINAYRQAQGLPVCTMFPLQHLFGGTPSC